MTSRLDAIEQRYSRWHVAYADDIPDLVAVARAAQTVDSDGNCLTDCWAPVEGGEAFGFPGEHRCYECQGCKLGAVLRPLLAEETT